MFFQANMAEQPLQRRGMRSSPKKKSSRSSSVALWASGQSPPYVLHIEVTDLQRVLFDEVAAGFDFVAHEDAEHVVGGAGVLHGDPD